MKTLLITPEGLEKLKTELDHLWRVERKDTTQKVTWAASLGDRSENADYHYNKKRLREIEYTLLKVRNLTSTATNTATIAKTKRPINSYSVDWPIKK